MKTIFAVVIVIIFYIVGVVFITRLDKSRNWGGDADAVWRTRNNLEHISLGIQWSCEVDNMYPVNLTSDVTNMTGRELFAILSRSKDAIGIASKKDVNTLSNCILLDGWKHEVHARFIVNGNTIHVILWSDGADGVNNNGKGDDVVDEFDMDFPTTDRL